MKILTSIATLFVIGSVLGYIIELFFRRIFTAKKWVNPGFMMGPYLPIYGFGTLILYGFCYIEIPSLPYAIVVTIKLVIIGVSMTLIELITGLIFLKFFNMRLWDYTNRKWNFKGVICPLFSFIWFIVGGLFYVLLYSVLADAVEFISDNTIYTFFVGIVVGMIIIDACYSFHLGIKVKQSLDGMRIRYDQFRESFKEHLLTKNQKRKSAFMALLASQKEEIKKFAFKNKHKNSDTINRK